MSKALGKIKITEDRIYTTQNGVTETWTKIGGDESKFIIYEGLRWKLLKSKEVEVEEEEEVD